MSTSPVVLIYAAPGCGAGQFVDALSRTRRFESVPERDFPVGSIASIFDNFSVAPSPGLHFLADYRHLATAARHLADSVIGSAGSQIDGKTCARVVFSTRNGAHVRLLRDLYPDALHVHLVRDISGDAVRIASRSQCSVWQLCRQWRADQRAILEAPPWLRQLTVRYEDLEADPVEAVDAIGSLAGLSLTAAEQRAFAEVFIGAGGAKPGRVGMAAATSGDGSRSAAPRALASWVGSRLAAAYCHAELAAFNYKRSIGAPGTVRRVLTTAALRLL